MSDISKKIHSIDPADLVEPVASGTRGKTKLSSLEPVPGFVSRPTPMIVPEDESQSSGRWVIWMGIVFALMWIGATVTYFMMKPVGALSRLSTLDLAGMAITVLFPAVLILLFCIASFKLSRISAKAARLSQIGETLLRADDVAAVEAQSLATSIRAEMAKLNDEVTLAADRLKALQQQASDHSELLNNSSSSFLATSDVIGQNLTLQRQSLESMAQTTEARLDSLSTLVELRKDGFTEATAISAKALETAGTDLEEKVGQFDGFIAGIESKLAKVTATLSETEEKSKNTIEQVSAKTELLETAISELTAQNSALQTLLETQLAQLKKLQDANQDANEALSETVQHCITATENLRQETQTADALNEKWREDLVSGLLDLRKQADRTVSEHEEKLQNTLKNTDKTLSSLETRAFRVQQQANDIEGQQLAQAETQDMALDVPNQPAKKSLSGRLNLKPLDTDFPSLEPQRPVTTPAPSARFEPELDPLDLNTEMLISTPSDALPNNDDLIRPLGGKSTIFGKKKEKSPWRWRDMIGGFESEDINTPELEGSPQALEAVPAAVAQTNTIKSQSFDAWLAEIGLDADVVVSDGTILDYANALSTEPYTAQDVLFKRLPDVSEHLKSIALSDAGFSQAALAYKGAYSDNINPEIMNRDALRNRLSTKDGKSYLLSLLVA